LKNERAAHPQASAQMFCVGDNPFLHAIELWQRRNKSNAPALTTPKMSSGINSFMRWKIF
jgi:hypothetical protein